MAELYPGQKSVLLIHEENEEADTIKSALTGARYFVNTVPTARQAFGALFKSPPDVIILDINLPDLDGLHVAKELKRNMMLRHIPLIVLTSRIDFLEKMRSLDVIVDEYLVRPFDIKELLIRAELVRQRMQVSLDANPLTRLPGNNAIVAALRSHMGKGKPYAVGYADLNNFKSYNDKYGFSRGDDVIKFAAKSIVSAVQTLSPGKNFVGHVGGDDFIFVCGYEEANDVAQKIIDLFDAEIKSFYSPEDREKGFVLVEDRRGIVSQIPFVSVAIGLVSDEGKRFGNLGQINHSLTQLKKYAKSFNGSAVVRDRRSLANQLAEFTWGPGSSAGNGNVLESIATALGSYLPGQLDDIIKNKTINVLFQPILDMSSDEVVGHESLVRGPANTPLEFPDALFQTARTAGLVPQLDALCIERIIKSSVELRRGMKLFINVFPETLLDPRSLNELLKINGASNQLSVVFELSGSNRAEEAAALIHILGKLKSAGQMVCVESNLLFTESALAQLSELKPDYVKLNMQTFKGMSEDPKKHADFVRTATMIRQIRSEAICSKLESRADSFLAIKSGVRYGQGFLFARPALSLTSSHVK